MTRARRRALHSYTVVPELLPGDPPLSATLLAHSMSFGAAVRNFMHREPIIAWSCIIASVGEPGVLAGPCEWPDTHLCSCPDAAYRHCSVCAVLDAGLILPIVVPPIRERFSPRDTVYPPPIKQVGCWAICTNSL